MSYPIDLSIRHADEYRSFFLWPMVSFQVYPATSSTPITGAPMAWSAARSGAAGTPRTGWDDEVIRRLAMQTAATTVEEDIRIVESVQRGLQSRGYRPGPLVVDPACGLNSEHSVQTLQQWMREGIES